MTVVPRVAYKHDVDLYFKGNVLVAFVSVRRRSNIKNEFIVSLMSDEKGHLTEVTVSGKSLQSPLVFRTHWISRGLTNMISSQTVLQTLCLFLDSEYVDCCVTGLVLDLKLSQKRKCCLRYVLNLEARCIARQTFQIDGIWKQTQPPLAKKDTATSNWITKYPHKHANEERAASYIADVNDTNIKY